MVYERVAGRKETAGRGRKKEGENRKRREEGRGRLEERGDGEKV